jgi:hypothetical protein
LPRTAVTSVAANGAPAGMTAPLAAEALPVPISLRATTVNV